MDAIATCPSAESLKGLLDGALAPDQQTVVAGHLETCEVCQRTLEGLVAGKESWSGAAQQLAGGAAGHDEALAAVIEHARQASPGETHGEAPCSEAPSLDFLKPSDDPGCLGRLGPYDVIQIVGRGGFGIVLKAFDSSLRRVVAIKVVSPQLAMSSTARRRFVREARAAAAVNHDHVVAIHAVEEAHDPPYFVMQFVEGKTLQERLDASGPLALTEILRIGMQAAAGLAAAHDQGLVHRDIKPANILLENGVERVKITDFGLARAADDASLTQSGVVAGTPQFMSPEQAGGESVDTRADLFSLGSVLYAMCTGRPPFRASTTMGVLKRVCDEDARPIREINSEIPEWLEAIVTKLLAKNPADRFQSAFEVSDLLGKHLAHVQQPRLAPLPPAVRAAVARGRFADSPQAVKTGGMNAPATEPHTGLLERLVRFGLLLMGVGGLVQLVILLFLFTRGLAVRWAITGVVAGFGLLLLAAVGHLLRSWARRPAAPLAAKSDAPPGSWLRGVPLAAWFGLLPFAVIYLAAFAELQQQVSATTSRGVAVLALCFAILYLAIFGAAALVRQLVRGQTHPAVEPRPWRIVMFFSLMLFFTGMFLFNGWVRDPKQAVDAFLLSLPDTRDLAPEHRTHRRHNVIAKDGKTRRQAEQGVRAEIKEPVDAIADGQTSGPKSAPAAIIRELRELVAQSEQELSRVQQQHAAGTAPSEEVRRSQRMMIEAKARLASAEGKPDEAIAAYEQIVQLHEKTIELIGQLVESGSVPPSELSLARKDLAEARIRLETAPSANWAIPVPTA